jgi:hypothetical protein
MKRLGLALLFVLLSTTASWAACNANGANAWIATDWASLATCRDSASVAAGDTITFTPNTYTMSSNMAAATSSKHLIIDGTGVTLTDEVANGTCAITIPESTTSSTRNGLQHSTWFKNFTINRGASNGRHSNPAGVICLTTTASGKPILISGNTYNLDTVNGDGGSGDFIIAGVNRGVIWNNTMQAQADPGFANNTCNNNASFVRHKISGGTWGTAPTYGSADTSGNLHLYIENNTVNEAYEGYDGDDTARTVIRFNTWTDSATGTHGMETSGIGSRYVEFYGNSYVRQTNQCTIGADSTIPPNLTTWISWRGGTGIAHNNTLPDIPVTAAWGAGRPEIILFGEMIWRNVGTYPCWGTTTTPGGYPMPRQVGWGYSSGGTQAGATGIFQDLEPVYIFPGTGTGSTTPSIQGYGSSDGLCGSSEVPGDYIQHNRDFYRPDSCTAGGACTSGTGSGASLPTTCTTGTGFWKTNEGSWNDGSNGNYTGQGVMYKCTATDTWTSFYTPYTFPHPLTADAGGGGGTTTTFQGGITVRGGVTIR